MNRSRSGPRTLIALVGAVAIVGAACGGASHVTGTECDRRASAAAVEPPHRRPPSPSPSRPRRRRGPAPTAAPSSAGSSASAPARQPAAAPGRGRRSSTTFNDVAEGRLHLARDLRQQRRRATSSRPRSPPATRRTSSGRSASRASTSSATSCSTSTPLDRHRPATTSTGVDPKLVDFFKLGENGATVGLPFAVYPSFMYYNKDLFDEAGLPYPPTKVGDLYDGKPWDMDAVRDARP